MARIIQRYEEEEIGVEKKGERSSEKGGKYGKSGNFWKSMARLNLTFPEQAGQKEEGLRVRFSDKATSSAQRG